MKLILKILTITAIVILTEVVGFGQWINCDSKLYQDSLFEVELVDTVKFGENTTPGGKFKELYMHIYAPVNDTSSYRPALVLAFGGAYIRGSKEDVAPVCEMFAARGYVCASIDYRLFDAFKIPDSTVILDIGMKAREDMIASIKYLKWSVDNGNKWKINPDYVFVGGASSGAITALSVAYFNESDSVDVKDWMKPVLEDNGGFEGASNLDFTKDYDYEVKGVANMLGAVVDLDYIDKGDPILVSIHGTEDDVVPYAEGDIKLLEIPVFRLFGSSLVHKRALEEEIHSSFISVEGGGHGGFLKDENLPWLDSMVNTTTNDFYNYALCPETPNSITVTQSNRFEIYPNPASGFIKIDTDLKEIVNISIYTLSGILVKTLDLQSISNTIDISDLKEGVFILKASNYNGIVLDKKVFIVKT